MPRLELEEGAHLPDVDLVIARRSGRYTISHKQFAPERLPRPAEHRHDYGQNEMPVLAFDLHRTLTPDIGYPLMSDPFFCVKEGMDQFAARGCCIHVWSASLNDTDPDIVAARQAIGMQWFRSNGLPVSIFGPNSEASTRIDDRGVSVPENPDWDALWGIAEKKLAKTYDIDKKTGKYVRRQDLKPVGDIIDDDEYPNDEDVPPDQPRGYTTPLIDIDLHRTLMPAWGTRRDAPPNPDGVACVRDWYRAGYSIQISCAGWNPALVDNAKFTSQRAAWQRRYLRQWGIPYDRLVTKDDFDIWFDDNVLAYTGDWKVLDRDIKAHYGDDVRSWPARAIGDIPNAPIK